MKVNGSRHNSLWIRNTEGCPEYRLENEARKRTSNCRKKNAIEEIKTN